MSDYLKIPHKISFSVAKYEADGTLIEETVPHETWYEPGPDGAVAVTDPDRIAELEARAAEIAAQSEPPADQPVQNRSKAWV